MRRPITRRRIRFSPILIMSLVAVLLTTLFSVSDLVGFLALTIGACLTLALFATDMVEKRINDNIEKARAKAMKTGTVGKRKLRVLSWPKDSLRQGTRYWGLASFFFAVQIAIDTIGPYFPFPFPQTYDIFAWGGGALSLIAAFHTALTVEFIMNPDYRPRINLRLIFYALVMFASDVEMAFLFLVLYPVFGTLNILGKAFLVLVVSSIVSTIPFWWAYWREKKTLIYALFVPVFAPYAFLLIGIGIAFLGAFLS